MLTEYIKQNIPSYLNGLWSKTMTRLFIWLFLSHKYEPFRDIITGKPMRKINNTILISKLIKTQ